MVAGFATPDRRRKPSAPEAQPDIPRLATEADYQLAGQLSTIWPMSSRHPSDALHLAIYVNDYVRTVEP